MKNNHELRFWLETQINNQNMEANDTIYGKKAFNETTGTFDKMLVQGEADRSDTVTKIMPGGKVADGNTIAGVDTV